MRISVKVTPNAKSNEIVEVGPNNFKVKVAAPAKDGKANAELIKFLAEKFHVSSSKIKIVQGAHDRNKIVEIIS